jgi:hypothetical protein
MWHETPHFVRSKGRASSNRAFLASVGASNAASPAVDASSSEIAGQLRASDATSVQATPRDREVKPRPSPLPSRATS